MSRTSIRKTKVDNSSHAWNAPFSSPSTVTQTSVGYLPISPAAVRIMIDSMWEYWFWPEARLPEGLRY